MSLSASSACKAQQISWSKVVLQKVKACCHRLAEDVTDLAKACNLSCQQLVHAYPHRLPHACSIKGTGTGWQQSNAATNVMLIHHLLDIIVITVIGHSDSLEVQVHSHNRCAEAEADLSRMQSLSFINQKSTNLISEDAQASWGMFHWHLKLAKDCSILVIEGCCCMTNNLLKATRHGVKSKIPSAIQECRGKVASQQELLARLVVHRCRPTCSVLCIVCKA